MEASATKLGTRSTTTTIPASINSGAHLQLGGVCVDAEPFIDARYDLTLYSGEQEEFDRTLR